MARQPRNADSGEPVESANPGLPEGWDFSDAVKVSIRRIKMEEPGDSFVGTYQDVREDTISDKDHPGQTKQLTLLLFDDPQGEPCELAADTMLQRLFLDTRKVKRGDRVKITKNEQLKLAAGRRMNQYELLVIPGVI